MVSQVGKTISVELWRRFPVGFVNKITFSVDMWIALSDLFFNSVSSYGSTTSLLCVLPSPPASFLGK